MMLLLSGLVFWSKICGGDFKTYPATFDVALPVFQKDLSQIDEIYNSFYSVSDYREDVVSQIEQLYLNKMKQHHTKSSLGKPNKVEQTYLLVKTMRHRDKRYISYLTLCHFKICNMGRKRTNRYFHMISTLDDNES